MVPIHSVPNSMWRTVMSISTLVSGSLANSPAEKRIFGKQPRRGNVWTSMIWIGFKVVEPGNILRCKISPVAPELREAAATGSNCQRWWSPFRTHLFSELIWVPVGLCEKANYCLHLKEGDILCDVRELNPADRISKGWGSRPNAERRTPLGQACVHRSARFCGYRVCCFSFQSVFTFYRGKLKKGNYAS